MPWLILRVEPAKELKVCHNLEGIFETYCPMECRHYRAGKGRARNNKEIPLLPRLVFIHRPFVDGLVDIIGHKYCLGLGRDAQGCVLIIPDWQMEIFEATVAQWRENALAAHYKPNKRKRPKLHSFEALKEYFDGLAKLEEAA